MKCPHCGRLDFESSEVCPRCGEAMPAGSGEHSSSGSIERSGSHKASARERTPAPTPGPLFGASSQATQNETENLIRVEESLPMPDDDAPSVPVSQRLSNSAVETPPPTRTENKRRGSSDSYAQMVTSDSRKPLTETLPPPKRAPLDSYSTYPAMVTSDMKTGVDTGEIYRGESGDHFRKGSGDRQQERSGEKSPERLGERSGERSGERIGDRSAERAASRSSTSAERRVYTGTPQRMKTSDTYPPRDYLNKIKAKSSTPQTPVKEGGKVVAPTPYTTESATFSSELSTDWIEKYSRKHVSSDADRAGLTIRGWAFAIDWLLLIALGVILLLTGRLVVTLLGDGNYTPGKLLSILSLPVGVVWIVIVLCYFTFFTAAGGQTPGKFALGLRVMGPDGQPPELTMSALRAVIYVAGVLALGAGLWWVFIDKRKRPLHDLLTRTTVMTVFAGK